MSGWQPLCCLGVHGGGEREEDSVDFRTGTSVRTPLTALGRRAKRSVHRRPARQVPGAHRRTGTHFPVWPGILQGSPLV